MKTKEPLETYKCVCFCTSHITSQDSYVLTTLSATNSSMVMSRDSGFFIKLYEEPEHNKNKYYSEALNKIIHFACKCGYRLIEFDRDAEEYPDMFETFNW